MTRKKTSLSGADKENEQPLSDEKYEADDELYSKLQTLIQSTAQSTETRLKEHFSAEL